MLRSVRIDLLGDPRRLAVPLPKAPLAASVLRACEREDGNVTRSREAIPLRGELARGHAPVAVQDDEQRWRRRRLRRDRDAVLARLVRRSLTCSRRLGNEATKRRAREWLPERRVDELRAAIDDEPRAAVLFRPQDGEALRRHVA